LAGLNRRDILQIGAAAAALVAGEGTLTRAFAQQRLTEAELLKFDATGNVTLLHVRIFMASLRRSIFASRR